MQLPEFLSYFPDYDAENDGWVATCPAHNDSHPSLRVAVTPDGKALLKCRAGCDTSAVLAAAGLSFTDLEGITDLDAVPTVQNKTPANDSARGMVAAQAYGWAATLTAIAPYGDPVCDLLRDRFGIDPANLTVADAEALGIGYEDGRLMVVARTADGRVAFVQGRAVDPTDPVRWKGLANPSGGHWDAAGFVGKVTGDRAVIVCEGPSDALCVAALNEYDAIAIRGASQGRRITELAGALKGRTVYVAGDGDNAGRKFNRLVIDALKGVAASVSAVPVPDGQDLGDVRANAPEGFSEALHDLIEGSTVSAPTGLTDIELAEYAYRTQFAGRLAFSRTQGWRYFPEDGAHWIHDVDGDEVRRRVQRLLRTLLDGAENDRQRMNLGSTAKRNNVVSAMESLDETNYAGGWDEAEHLLAAPNGVIDLRTGELIPGTPDQRLSRAVKIPYNPDAKAPRFERFMSEIFAHDPELPAYVQRLLGYGITGSNAEQCFAVLVGEGSNGKSTLLTVLREIMGEHAATVPFDMFTVTGKARGGPETEHLVGARLALASETNRTAVLDSAAIKNATGGEEINVNPKYRKPYSFTPQALILLATNYKPIIKEQDAGTWRRVKVLPFTQKFEKDTRLADELRAEYEGILAWLVRGAVEWYRNGLNDPASITEAIEAYRDESDALSGFLPGVLVMDPDRWTSNADLWAAYTEWAEAEGMDAFRRSDTLNKALLERGKGAIVAKKKGGKRGLAGVVLASVLQEEALADASPEIFRHRAEVLRRETNVG